MSSTLHSRPDLVLTAQTDRLVPAMAPTLADILDCIGWHWKAALALLLASPAAALLPQPVAIWTGLGLLAGSAVLALSASSSLVRQALDAAPIDPPAAEADPLMTLSAILEGQRTQMHDAAAAVSRAVTAGAQLAGLSRNAEQHWRSLIEQSAAAPQTAPAISLLEEIRASLVLAQEESAAARKAAEKDLRRRLDDVRDRLDALAAVSSAPAALPPPAAEPKLERILQALESLSRQVSAQSGQAAHHEASLGDAARYLTETADRLRDGTRAVETHAVRLQALISLTGHRQDETASIQARQAALTEQLEEILAASSGLPASFSQAVFPPGDPRPSLRPGVAGHPRQPDPPRP